MVVFMVFMTAGIGVLMSGISERYGTEYTASDIGFYNKLGSISNTSQEIKNTTMSISSKSGVTDLLGGFFESAYATLKISANSFGLFNEMGNRAIQDTGISDPSGAITSGIFIIVIIAIFLGIVISSVVKREV
jgi:hypothetical protein